MDHSSARLQQIVPDEHPTPQTLGQRAEDRVELSRAILELPAAQREAIELRYLEDLPLSEITQRMNRSPASVGGLLQRGLAKLRDQMRT